MRSPVRVHVEPRGVPSPVLLALGPVATVMAALLVVAIPILITGFDPLTVYSTILDSAFGDATRVQQTLLAAGPLVFTGLAAAIAFKMKVFNIGGEGQLYMGAIASSGFAIFLGDTLPQVLTLPLALVAGAVGGLSIAAVAAYLYLRFGTNEAISTLMLNFVALNLMLYLIFDSLSAWRDPARPTFPVGRPIPEAAELPGVWGGADLAIVIAAIVAVGLWWGLKHTSWGFRARLIGANPRTAVAQGVAIDRGRFIILCVSGMLAGLAGAALVAGPLKALTPEAMITTRLGFTGILVAAVARFNTLAVVPVAVAIAGLLNSSRALQLEDIPYAIALTLIGALFIVVIAGDFFVRHRVSVRRVDAPVEVRPRLAEAES